MRPRWTASESETRSPVSGSTSSPEDGSNKPDLTADWRVTRSPVAGLVMRPRLMEQARFWMGSWTVQTELPLAVLELSRTSSTNEASSEYLKVKKREFYKLCIFKNHEEILGGWKRVLD